MSFSRDSFMFRLCTFKVLQKPGNLDSTQCVIITADEEMWGFVSLSQTGMLSCLLRGEGDDWMLDKQPQIFTFSWSWYHAVTYASFFPCLQATGSLYILTPHFSVFWILIFFTSHVMKLELLVAVVCVLPNWQVGPKPKVWIISSVTRCFSHSCRRDKTG